ncbi:hypothetical protein TrLO_g12665, partial [Triparma laevis f. longispina]
ECYILGTPIDGLGHILSYLTPSERYEFLTTTGSRRFHQRYTSSSYLWLKLCQQSPHNSSSSVKPAALLGNANTATMCTARVQFMNFLKCSSYLRQVLADSKSGRRQQLPVFTQTQTQIGGGGEMVKRSPPPHTPTTTTKSPKPSRGPSEITKRLLAAATNGNSPSPLRTPLQTNKNITTAVNPTALVLPWTSIPNTLLNWLSFYSHVEGLVGLCFEAFPTILSDESSRESAQKAGLIKTVFLSILKFGERPNLVRACLHTLVLLARPTGGVEGQMFNDSMLAPIGLCDSLNGISVIIRCMRRFEGVNEDLLAMACWSLVNITLNITQKKCLVHLGGVECLLDIINRHIDNPEVAYRGLFALINIVIPPPRTEETNVERKVLEELLGPGLWTHRALWGRVTHHLQRIIVTVIAAMQRHFTVREIVNRGTLIFHNLSLDSRSGIEVRRSLIMNNSIQLLQETHRYWKEDNHILGYTQETLYRLFSALNEDPNLKEEYNIMYYEKRREEEKRRGEEQGPVCDF